MFVYQNTDAFSLVDGVEEKLNFVSRILNSLQCELHVA